MAKQFNMQVVAQITPDTGLEPACVLDTDNDQFDALALADFDEWSIRELQVAAGAVDTAVTFTDALVGVMFADGPLTVKVAAGETGLANLRFFAWAAADTSGGHPTSILLSNPGASAVQVKFKYVETPS